jgi:hypothetical protein
MILTVLTAKDVQTPTHVRITPWHIANGQISSKVLPMILIDSDSNEVWPIIVGALIGVVGLLILVIAGLLLLRYSCYKHTINLIQHINKNCFRSRRQQYHTPSQKGETRSPNAYYSSQDHPTVQLSFENPMYTNDQQIVENSIYNSRIDKSLFQIGNTEAIYQDFDEDGLPV